MQLPPRKPWPQGKLTLTRKGRYREKIVPVKLCFNRQRYILEKKGKKDSPRLEVKKRALNGEEGRRTDASMSQILGALKKKGNESMVNAKWPPLEEALGKQRNHSFPIQKKEEERFP